MLTRYLTVLVLSGLALAQQAQQPTQSAPAPRPRGGFGRGFGPGALLDRPNLEQRLTARLNLNATQQNAVHTAIEESKVILKGVAEQERGLRTQLAAAVRSGNSASIDQLSQQLSAIHQQRIATEAKALSKIYASLNADQKAKIDPEVNRSLGAPGPRGGLGRGPRAGGNNSASPQPVQQ
ncbi:MAG TPA: hypothetical protein VKV74_07125 [Bryobacteraceae bacterium]|nr:hypothetical protein [Bryobacteraceae bacterium]